MDWNLMVGKPVLLVGKTLNDDFHFGVGILDEFPAEHAQQRQVGWLGSQYF